MVQSHVGADYGNIGAVSHRLKNRQWTAGAYQKVNSQERLYSGRHVVPDWNLFDLDIIFFEEPGIHPDISNGSPQFPSGIGKAYFLGAISGKSKARQSSDKPKDRNETQRS